MEPQEKILKTALSLFFKYGIKHVTMDDIAKELGISKKTIYQFYKEKDDLINQLMQIELKNQRCGFEDVSQNANDALHEILLISEQMTHMLQGVNPVFFKELQKFYPNAYSKYSAFKDEFARKHLHDNIMRGMADGVYRADLDVDFAADLRLSQIDMLFFGSYFNFEKLSFVKTNQNLLDCFVYGICTLKGHKQYNKYKKVNEDE
jgi:AcrR family transcriptional regulator